MPALSPNIQLFNLKSEKCDYLNENVMVSVINLLDIQTNEINQLLIELLFYFEVINFKKFNKELYDSVFNSTNSLYNQYKKSFNYDFKILSIANFEKLIILLNKIDLTNRKNVILQIIQIIKNSQNKTLTKFHKSIMNTFKSINLENLFELNNLNNENILFLNSPLIFYENNLFENFKNKNVDIYDMFTENITLFKLFTDTCKDYKNFSIENKNYIQENCINKLYNLIICYSPEGIRNIIHAQCCDRIKNLKIRGTKSEPLILQLIMKSLQKNGEAIVIVPDSLLYSDSNQHIETRKYLLENFDVKEVISVEKENHSILHFYNSGISKEVTFQKLTINKNLKTIKSIDFQIIKNKDYILFSDKYNETSNNNVELNYKLYDYVDIVTKENSKNIYIQALNNNYLKFPKYVNENKEIELKFNDFELDDDSITLIVKDTSKCLQKYVNYYLYNSLKKDIQLITSGKLNKIDYNKLFDYKIAIPSIKVQKNVISYYDINYQLIQDNEKQIEMLNIMKTKFLNIILLKNENIQLQEICKINTSINKDTYIIVNKNSSLAGTVNLLTNDHKENNNFYYINDIQNFNKECLYFVLKHEEHSLKKLASLTQNINLSRKSLETFEIKNLPTKLQENIAEECKKYSNMIENLEKTNEHLLNINIFDIISSM
jgi:hypothetical protein